MSAELPRSYLCRRQNGAVYLRPSVRLCEVGHFDDHLIRIGGFD